jgi:hypothetical protein
MVTGGFLNAAKVWIICQAFFPTAYFNVAFSNCVNEYFSCYKELKVANWCRDDLYKKLSDNKCQFYLEQDKWTQ